MSESAAQASVSDTAAPAEAAPGARLRAAREAQSLSREEVAKRLNLDAWIIEALEAEDFSRLPERIYVRGYINAYCKLLNQSSEPICTRLIQDDYHFSPLPAGSLVQKVPVTRRANSWLRPLAAVLIVVLGLILAYALLGGWLRTYFERSFADTEASDVAATPMAAPAHAVEAAPAPDRSLIAPTSLPPAASLSATPAPELLVKAQTEDYQPPSEMEAPHAGTAAKQTGSQPVPAAVAAVPRGQGPDRLELRLAEASWVEIKDAGGKRLAWGTLTPGTHVFAGTSPFDLTLGHPRGVTVEFNGKPFPLHAAQKNAVARLTLGSASKPAP